MVLAKHILTVAAALVLTRAVRADMVPLSAWDTGSHCPTLVTSDCPPPVGSGWLRSIFLPCLGRPGSAACRPLRRCPGGCRTRRCVTTGLHPGGQTG